MASSGQLPASTVIRNKALSVRKAIDGVIAKLDGDPAALQEELGKADGVLEYIKRLQMAADDKRDAANIITVARLKLIAAIGRALPREQGGRGKKSEHTVPSLERHTIARYRKVADAESLIEEYEGVLDDSDIDASIAGFIRFASDGTPHVSHNSGENEWYTPPEYIEAARAVMGGIDLDPASSDVAQKTVKAKTYYTLAINGLEQEWRGRVWMNPPYSREDISAFISKLTRHATTKDISQAVVLINNATETEWFSVLMSVASSVCLIRGRIQFLNADGEVANSPLQGQVVAYVGRRSARFADVFSEFGVVCNVVR